MKKENNPVHRNSCGEPIYDKHGNIAICCGDALDSDGATGAFAQCEKCREKDYTDVKENESLSDWIEEDIDKIDVSGVKEKIQEFLDELKEYKTERYGNKVIIFNEKILDKLAIKKFGGKLI